MLQEPILLYGFREGLPSEGIANLVIFLVFARQRMPETHEEDSPIDDPHLEMSVQSLLLCLNSDIGERKDHVFYADGKFHDLRRNCEVLQQREEEKEPLGGSFGIACRRSHRTGSWCRPAHARIIMRC